MTSELASEVQNNLKNELIGLVRLNYKDNVESTKTKLRFNKGDKGT